jgi:hypothetical protein
MSRRPSKKSTPIYVTSDARARHANNELSGMLHRFAIGEVRSVVCVTAWADEGEPGGSFHLENSTDTGIIIGHMTKMLAIFEELRVKQIANEKAAESS